MASGPLNKNVLAEYERDGFVIARAMFDSGLYGGYGNTCSRISFSVISSPSSVRATMNPSSFAGCGNDAITSSASRRSSWRSTSCRDGVMPSAFAMMRDRSSHYPAPGA